MVLLLYIPGDDPFLALASAILPLMQTESSGETDKLLEHRKTAQALREGELALSDYLPRLLEIHAARRLFLLIDQFEQLFTSQRDDEAIRTFIDLLLT